MIKDNEGKSISKVIVFKGNKPLIITKIYKASKLVWTAFKDIINSCFGAGFWKNDKPWNNNDAWKNRN